MIETEPITDFAPDRAFERQLAANVWLRQTEKEGQFVEIVLPPLELNDLIQECITDFPRYVIELSQVTVENDSTTLVPGTDFAPELLKGLLNTQILGMVLARHPFRPEEKLDHFPELKQAFGLAMKGRLRLTADPLPDDV